MQRNLDAFSSLPYALQPYPDYQALVTGPVLWQRTSGRLWSPSMPGMSASGPQHAPAGLRPRPRANPLSSGQAPSWLPPGACLSKASAAHRAHRAASVPYQRQYRSTAQRNDRSPSDSTFRTRHVQLPIRWRSPPPAVSNSPTSAAWGFHSKDNGSVSTAQGASDSPQLQTHAPGISTSWRQASSARPQHALVFDRGKQVAKYGSRGASGLTAPRPALAVITNTTPPGMVRSESTGRQPPSEGPFLPLRQLVHQALLAGSKAYRAAPLLPQPDPANSTTDKRDSQKPQHYQHHQQQKKEEWSPPAANAMRWHHRQGLTQQKQQAPFQQVWSIATDLDQQQHPQQPALGGSPSCLAPWLLTDYYDAAASTVLPKSVAPRPAALKAAAGVMPGCPPAEEDEEKDCALRSSFADHDFPSPVDALLGSLGVYHTSSCLSGHWHERCPDNRKASGRAGRIPGSAAAAVQDNSKPVNLGRPVAEPARPAAQSGSLAAHHQDDLQLQQRWSQASSCGLAAAAPAPKGAGSSLLPRALPESLLVPSNRSPTTDVVSAVGRRIPRSPSASPSGRASGQVTTTVEFFASSPPGPSAPWMSPGKPSGRANASAETRCAAPSSSQWLAGSGSETSSLASAMLSRPSTVAYSPHRHHQQHQQDKPASPYPQLQTHPHGACQDGPSGRCSANVSAPVSPSTMTLGQPQPPHPLAAPSRQCYHDDRENQQLPQARHHMQRPQDYGPLSYMPDLQQNFPDPRVYPSAGATHSPLQRHLTERDRGPATSTSGTLGPPAYATRWRAEEHLEGESDFSAGSLSVLPHLSTLSFRDPHVQPSAHAAPTRPPPSLQPIPAEWLEGVDELLALLSPRPPASSQLHPDPDLRAIYHHHPDLTPAAAPERVWPRQPYPHSPRRTSPEIAPTEQRPCDTVPMQSQRQPQSVSRMQLQHRDNPQRPQLQDQDVHRAATTLQQALSDNHILRRPSPPIFPIDRKPVAQQRREAPARGQVRERCQDHSKDNTRSFSPSWEQQQRRRLQRSPAAWQYEPVTTAPLSSQLHRRNAQTNTAVAESGLTLQGRDKAAALPWTPPGVAPLGMRRVHAIEEARAKLQSAARQEQQPSGGPPQPLNVRYVGPRSGGTAGLMTDHSQHQKQPAHGREQVRASGGVQHSNFDAFASAIAGRLLIEAEQMDLAATPLSSGLAPTHVEGFAIGGVGGGGAYPKEHQKQPAPEGLSLLPSESSAALHRVPEAGRSPSVGRPVRMAQRHLPSLSPRMEAVDEFLGRCTSDPGRPCIPVQGRRPTSPVHVQDSTCQALHPGVDDGKALSGRVSPLSCWRDHGPDCNITTGPPHCAMPEVSTPWGHRAAAGPVAPQQQQTWRALPKHVVQPEVLQLSRRVFKGWCRQVELSRLCTLLLSARGQDLQSRVLQALKDLSHRQHALRQFAWATVTSRRLLRLLRTAWLTWRSIHAAGRYMSRVAVAHCCRSLAARALRGWITRWARAASVQVLLRHRAAATVRACLGAWREEATCARLKAAGAASAAAAAAAGEVVVTSVSAARDGSGGAFGGVGAQQPGPVPVRRGQQWPGQEQHLQNPQELLQASHHHHHPGVVLSQVAIRGQWGAGSVEASWPSEQSAAVKHRLALEQEEDGEHKADEAQAGEEEQDLEYGREVHRALRLRNCFRSWLLLTDAAVQVMSQQLGLRSQLHDELLQDAALCTAAADICRHRYLAPAFHSWRALTAVADASVSTAVAPSSTPLPPPLDSQLKQQRGNRGTPGEQASKTHPMDAPAGGSLKLQRLLPAANGAVHGSELGLTIAPEVQQPSSSQGGVVPWVMSGSLDSLSGRRPPPPQHPLVVASIGAVPSEGRPRASLHGGSSSSGTCGSAGTGGGGSRDSSGGSFQFTWPLQRVQPCVGVTPQGDRLCADPDPGIRPWPNICSSSSSGGGSVIDGVHATVNCGRRSGVTVGLTQLQDGIQLPSPPHTPVLDLRHVPTPDSGRSKTSGGGSGGQRGGGLSASGLSSSSTGTQRQSAGGASASLLSPLNTPPSVHATRLVQSLSGGLDSLGRSGGGARAGGSGEGADELAGGRAVLAVLAPDALLKLLESDLAWYTEQYLTPSREVVESFGSTHSTGGGSSSGAAASSGAMATSGLVDAAAEAHAGRVVTTAAMTTLGGAALVQSLVDGGEIRTEAAVARDHVIPQLEAKAHASRLDRMGNGPAGQRIGGCGGFEQGLNKDGGEGSVQTLRPQLNVPTHTQQTHMQPHQQATVVLHTKGNGTGNGGGMAASGAVGALPRMDSWRRGIRNRSSSSSSSGSSSSGSRGNASAQGGGRGSGAFPFKISGQWPPMGEYVASPTASDDEAPYKHYVALPGDYGVLRLRGEQWQPAEP